MVKIRYEMNSRSLSWVMKGDNQTKKTNLQLNAKSNDLKYKEMKPERTQIEE